MAVPKRKMSKCRREKLEKAGLDPNKVDRMANLNTRNIPSNKPTRSMSDKASVNSVSKKEKDAAMKEATEYYNNNNTKYAPGSIAAKANMVSQYNNRKDD